MKRSQRSVRPPPPKRARQWLGGAAAIPVLFMVGVVAGQPSSHDSTASSCNNCGVITSIQMTTQEEQWAPVGVVPATGTSAHPTGSTTRSAFEFGREGSRGLVVVGAAGGATYGRQAGSYRRPRWGVTVRMDDGATRVVQQNYEPFVREGDRIRIMGTQLELVN